MSGGEKLWKTPLYVAVHEAGHAVAILASESSRCIEYLSIIDQPDGQQGCTASQARFQPAFGHLDTEPTVAAELANAAWLDIVELFAGSVAEKRFRGQSEVGRALDARYLAEKFAVGALTPAPDEDADKILLRLRWLDRERLATEFVRGWEQAENVLRPRWKGVVELGRWLHRQGRIEGGELSQWWRLQIT